jgi:hypothetical protein
MNLQQAGWKKAIARHIANNPGAVDDDPDWSPEPSGFSATESMR